jgi:hypothetical protein
VKPQGPKTLALKQTSKQLVVILTDFSMPLPLNDINQPKKHKKHVEAQTRKNE